MIKLISKEALSDKIHGYWVGQLAGNYVGFPFENKYDEKPIPVFIDRYMNYKDAKYLNLKMNLEDRRGFVDIMAQAMGGAWSDDDTDIEFVLLHGLEKYGLDITYKELAMLRSEHIKRFIWLSNSRVKELIDEGYFPPETGSKELNEHWYTLGSQLYNEIFGVVYSGMTAKAGEWGKWGALVGHDDWATHGTILFTAMYSAAFFENDVHELLRIGMAQMPADSPYLAAIKNVIKWHNENKEWKVTRQLIHDNYYKEFDGFKIPYPMAGAVINGLNGIMALLYGNGDFTKTIGIATTTGYDCDNQAATMGGLLGVMNGSKSIPDKFTKELPSRGKWEVPFNNTYINYSRDNLPNYNKISDIVERIVILSEKAIIENGGQISNSDENTTYHIKCDF
ncbi:ADP-ribosylglycohydrolase family protein [Aurantibacter crassamenti]|uniref:ADP-ribosylglycohydrolase family protein n=1 Tax=Aurantibacter crassamenti TaxID=1837375 RepID=UPI00193A8650|nr:ADP-ribosylglycohydrolase family protein [Aurantibacter crassamenti]MBM1105159.1 ADP-ribosylglycohydrolase family protein [Aurantibacter crassamenti]